MLPAIVTIKFLLALGRPAVPKFGPVPDSKGPLVKCSVNPLANADRD